MCEEILNKIVKDEDNYNFIISNVILSQTEEFTYNDILNKIKAMFGELTEKIEGIVKSCLIRLREDGFLTILGSNYSVVELNI